MAIAIALSGLAPRDLIRRAPELASPPEVLSKLLAALSDAESQRIPVAEIGRLIEHDAALSARLLKIVNSALYGMPRTVLSIKQAIQIVGLSELRNLIVGTLVIDRFSALPSPLMSMRQFWQTSVRCALWSREIGRLVAMPAGSSQESLFLCGLLHEVGRLVVYRLLPEASRAACLRVERGDCGDVAAIRAELGFDYYHVAAELSQLWRLPEELAITQLYHSTPLEAPQYQRECAIVALSAGLSSSDDIHNPPGEILYLCQYFGLADERRSLLNGEVERNFAEAIALFAS